MLQAHYARNRTPKAPNPSRTRRAPESSPPSPPSPNLDSDTRKLNSYPSCWQEVINYAKQTFRAYIAGQDGFPDGVRGMEEARECLDDALAVYLEDGGRVEPGTLNEQIHRTNVIRLLQALISTKT